jgi:hypothetical protein
MAKMSSVDLQIQDGLEMAMYAALHVDPEFDNLEEFVCEQAESFMNPLVAGIWVELPEDYRKELAKKVVSKLLH